MAEVTREMMDAGVVDILNGRVCEITPEMIEAGVDVFFEFDCVEDSPAQIVREIFQAMTRQAQDRLEVSAR